MAEKTMRADAADNRARIVAIARRMLTETSDLKMSAVAKEAQLGQGTVYRHFATRTALLSEVYSADVEELARSARELGAQHDAVTALRLWFRRVAEYAEVKYGVLAALSAPSGRELTTQHKGTIGQSVDALLEAGKRGGSIRPDVEASDVLLLLGFLANIDDADVARRAPHVLDLIVDSVVTQGHAPSER